MVDSIKQLKIKPSELNGFTREVYLREAYESTFSIFDHDNQMSTPPGYELVFMNDKENMVEHGELYNAIRRYHINKIQDEFGLSLTEFYNLPRDVVDFIFRLLGETRERIEAEKRKIASTDPLSGGLT